MKKLLTSVIFVCLFFAFLSLSQSPCAIAEEPVNSVPSGEASPVSIAMSTDNNYTYPTLVAMTSVMENTNKEIPYHFYVLLSGNFKQSSKDKILSLEKKYKNCKINLIDMKNAFKGAFTSRHITSAAYYRLALPSILSNLDKVLYMDVDTVTESDLSGLFYTNIDNYYLAGVKCPVIQARGPGYARMLGIRSIKSYINSGVMLMNLKKMREDKIESKFTNLARRKKFPFHDQDIINATCFGKIYHLPFKYNTMVSYGILNGWNYNDRSISSCFSRQSFVEGRKNPAIIHYQISTKPWNQKGMCMGSHWWKYASKSGFIKEIRARYGR